MQDLIASGIHGLEPTGPGPSDSVLGPDQDLFRTRICEESRSDSDQDRTGIEKILEISDPTDKIAYHEN